MKRNFESICNIEIDISIPCAIMSCHNNPEGEELRQIYECFLDTVKENTLTKAISDLRDNVIFSEADQLWIVEDLVPRLYAAGLRYSAIILPHNDFIRIGIDNVIHMVSHAEIQMQYFTSVEAAKDWLVCV